MSWRGPAGWAWPGWWRGEAHRWAREYSSGRCTARPAVPQARGRQGSAGVTASGDTGTVGDVAFAAPLGHTRQGEDLEFNGSPCGALLNVEAV